MLSKHEGFVSPGGQADSCRDRGGKAILIVHALPLFIRE